MNARPRPRAATIVTAVALAAALLGACGNQPPVTVGLPSAAGPAPVPSGLESFYLQQASWAQCEEVGAAGAQCTQVLAPLDYADPNGATIGLAVARVPARLSEHRLGSLLVNPGGPGASGVELLGPAVSLIGGEVRDVFDIVGFDPRGVGGSSPVDCADDADLDAWRSAADDLRTATGVERRTADAAHLAQQCQQRSGTLLDHVDTVAAARDLDVLRAVLGDDRLTYLGLSYGTELGATYAHLYPERVGRLVLDAGLDPTMDDTARRLGLAAGFEAALRAYLLDCIVAGGCPLARQTDQAVDQVRALLDGLADAPLPTGTDRALTAGLAASGILLGVSDEASWPALTQAMSAALQREDGAGLLQLADIAAGRQADGTYLGNAFAASTAVTCLDSPRRLDVEGLRAHARALREASPTFGPFLLDPAIICSVWPAPPTGDTAPMTATGAEPILVVGTTHDPAAPYAWSVSLAEQLGSAHLLTYEGFGHTAYGHSNACIDRAVEAYLLRGELPAADQVC